MTTNKIYMHRKATRHGLLISGIFETFPEFSENGRIYTLDETLIFDDWVDRYYTAPVGYSYRDFDKIVRYVQEHGREGLNRA